MARLGLGSMLLAGIAAYGAYKYSTMNQYEKRRLKEKGQKFVDENLGEVKNMFGKKDRTHTSPGASYGENPYVQS